MAEELYNTNTQGNRTFTVAMWLLGIVAAGQALATGWAVMGRGSEISKQQLPDVEGIAVSGHRDQSASQSGVNLPGNGAQVATAAPAAGGLPPMPEVFRKQMQEAGKLLPAPPIEGLKGIQGSATLFQDSRSLNELLETTSRQLHPAHRVSDSDADRLLSTGIELRASGNTQAALRTLQSAEQKLPGHPRILSEIAGTYSQMGLDDKAASYWERVYKLGEEGAGAYFDMADMVLKGKRLDASSNMDSLLSIADIDEIRDNTVTAGERITLRITIQAKIGSKPLGNNMSLLVYFYDLVDGKQFLRSTADTSKSYISAPYDWNHGETESIEVTYYQPVFTPEQKRELGERVYYGYIVELYYQDELQDVVAAPRKLMSFNPSAPPASGGRSSGPDSSLFPK